MSFFRQDNCSTCGASPCRCFNQKSHHYDKPYENDPYGHATDAAKYHGKKWAGVSTGDGINGGNIPTPSIKVDTYLLSGMDNGKKWAAEHLLKEVSRQIETHVLDGNAEAVLSITEMSGLTMLRLLKEGGDLV